MYILGINAAWHDSAACLVRDGLVVAAAEEERFTGVKHHKRTTPFSAHALPFHAIGYCLDAAGIRLDQVDHVAYSIDPLILIDEESRRPEFVLPDSPPSQFSQPGYDPWKTIFLAAVTSAPRTLLESGEVPWHLWERWGFLDQGRGAHQWRFHFVEHHMAHAASAFLPSPFESAAILTLDGAGEKVSTLLGVGRGNALEKLREVEMPHSLGKFYEHITTHLGFLSNSDEYKVMALASYGEPRYAEAFRSNFRWTGDEEFQYWWPWFEELCGPPRRPRAPMEERHFDIAASAQVVLEEASLRLADWLHRQTGETNLCLAGGVALNCVMNSRLQQDSPFQRVWVQPAAGDAGTALGAALWVWAQERDSPERWRMEDAYLGPDYDDAAIEQALRHGKLDYERCPDIAAATAKCLAQGKVAGWFQGRMEFGPRALGARSILASPADPDMVQRLNQLKDREDFRPVAPAVLEEAAGEFFEDCQEAPFMMFVYQVRPEQADRVPAIRHVDNTARVQTVSAARAPLYHRAISQFRELTGLPLVVNTSFNSRGQPIVCTPQDALECFYTSPIDALAIGSYLLVK
jgi:carbamoyltransferase